MTARKMVDTTPLSRLILAQTISLAFKTCVCERDFECACVGARVESKVKPKRCDGSSVKKCSRSKGPHAGELHSYIHPPALTSSPQMNEMRNSGHVTARKYSAEKPWILEFNGSHIRHNYLTNTRSVFCPLNPPHFCLPPNLQKVNNNKSALARS